MTTEIAYAKEKYDAIVRLHANSRARGMSEAAIARLPKLPTYVKPFVLPPIVMATERNGARDLDAVETSTRKRYANVSDRPSEKLKDFVKSLPFEHSTKPTHRPPTAADRQRIEALMCEVARAARVEPSRIGAHKITSERRTATAGYDCTRSLVQIRHLAIKIVAELMGISSTHLARFYGFRDATGVRYAIQKTQYLLSIGDERITRTYAEALEAIRQRWPEYAA